MNLLQHWRQNFAANRAAGHLSHLTAQATASRESLEAALQDADLAYRQCPDHFGLAFSLGRGSERLASLMDWNDRTVWIERALSYYEEALRLAENSQLDGLASVPEADEARWEPSMSTAVRARLAASFAAGWLYAGEFRVRNPARAVTYLGWVTRALRGYHPAWYFLGEAYLLSEQFDQAEQTWQEAQERAPDEPVLQAVLRNLAVDRVHHAVKAEDWPRVLAELARTPDDAMPASERWTIAGDAHLALGDPAAARAAWHKALEADHLAVGVRRRLRKLGVL